MLAERFKRISITFLAQDDNLEDDRLVTNAIDKELVKWLDSAEKMGLRTHYRITNYDTTYIPETPINPGFSKVIVSVGIAYIAKPQ